MASMPPTPDAPKAAASSTNLAHQFPHYHKDVEHLNSVDVYRVLELFEVTDQAVGHAVKKLLCAGKRGGKGFEQDIREAVASLNRKLQMIAEDANKPIPVTLPRVGDVVPRVR